MPDKWDQRGIGLAKHVAGWSKDPSTKVGACIMDRKNRVSGVGYNGLPRNVVDAVDRLEDRRLKLDMTVHAEINAILFSGKTNGCTLYTWPLPPCARCMAQIIQAGIIRVVAPEDVAARWADSIMLGLRMAEEAGIRVDLVRQTGDD